MKYLILIAALLFSGCGGSADSDTPEDVLTDKDFGTFTLSVTCDYLDGFPALPPMLDLVYTDVYVDDFYNSFTITDTTTMVATIPDGEQVFNEALDVTGKAHFVLGGLGCYGDVSLDLATGFYNLWADCVFNEEICLIKYSGS